MYTLVRKRDGRYEPFFPEKIHATLQKLSYNLDLDYLDLNRIVEHVEAGKTEDMPTTDLQSLVALAAANLTTHHPDYAVLGGRLEVASLHRRTGKSFSDFVLSFPEGTLPGLSPDFIEAVREHKDALDIALRHSRDYEMTYFQFKTLQSTYLLKRDQVVIERPQWMFMRTAVSIHRSNITAALETYDLLSRGLMIHATPTLKNAGLKDAQLASCFMQAIDPTTMETTFRGLEQLATIFMRDGGIGVDLHNIPAKRTDRVPQQPGLVPLMRLIDTTITYTSQARPGRSSAGAMFIFPWHADILDFLDARRNIGQEELKTRNLFLALVIPNLFMHRVRDDKMWHVFDPADVPELQDRYGQDFESAYVRLEESGRATGSMPARKLWNRIMDSQAETGMPFMLFHDAMNSKSNQRNLGVINSSNLCTEIIQFTSATETAVCTLGSLVLPAYVTLDDDFDFAELHRVTKILVRNTDTILDRTYYPTPEARTSALKTRAIGIGVQGLADVFMMLRMPFDSVDAQRLNRAIFETIYHAAVDASCDLAREAQCPYPAWSGSPASDSLLQYDLWGQRPSARYDWDSLKARMRKYGLRNSLLTAQMPTSSTSQVTGVNDGTDPYLSNLYVRRGLGGEHQMVCRWLTRDLIARNLWNPHVRKQLMQNHGSVQQIEDVPEDLKAIYKTAWELPQKVLVDLAADRGPFICQSQSLSIYMANPTHQKLTSLHFYAWSAGLKTGMYYLRSQPATYPIQFDLLPERTAPRLQYNTPYRRPNVSPASDVSPSDSATLTGLNDTRSVDLEHGSAESSTCHLHASPVPCTLHSLADSPLEYAECAECSG
ncbi:ribonucleotide reductase large chain subunit [Polyporus arcularius HHB13444]|uniref:Ribonucleoside-diphosphate reductase n=1 Tax=Polyporus arcularius HHB13444 TaxID=1314778 RepID=A0A5C3P5Q1_9APHY|nr:ribonucleotide reductase large chain subunit [Polyporus arcularius HHB13444]